MKLPFKLVNTLEWHDCFALLPIWIDGYLIWLETYQRKGTSNGAWDAIIGPSWEYRIKPS